MVSFKARTILDGHHDWLVRASSEAKAEDSDLLIHRGLPDVFVSLRSTVHHTAIDLQG
jgi:hypothetical protein